MQISHQFQKSVYFYKSIMHITNRLRIDHKDHNSITNVTNLLQTDYKYYKYATNLLYIDDDHYNFFTNTPTRRASGKGLTSQPFGLQGG